MHVQIKINNGNIERVCENKFMGVILITKSAVK